MTTRRARDVVVLERFDCFFLFATFKINIILIVQSCRPPLRTHLHPRTPLYG